MSEFTLITGGSGFIGHHLVKSFDLDKKIVVVDNFSRGVPERLKNAGKNVKILNCDIRDSKKLSRELQTFDIDCIYHLAAINGTGNFYRIPIEIMDVGVLGCFNILNFAKERKVKKCIIASSAEVYQEPDTVPTLEDVTLKIPSYSNPRYSYALSKIYTEYYSYHFSLQNNMNTSIFRPHNVYGPDMGLQHVIPQFIMQFLQSDEENIDLLTKGPVDSTRAFAYVTDIVQGIKLLEDTDESVDVFNIGTNEMVTIREIIDNISTLLDKSFSISVDDQHLGSTPKRCPDIGKISSLGYSPKISFNQGLSSTLDWYQKNYNSLISIDNSIY